MNDLISRQWLMDCVNEGWIKFDTEKDENRFIHLVRDIAPSAEPRKRGKWIANGDIHKECPFCGEDWDKYVFGEVWYTDELPKFCPNCGADMREGEEK